MNRRSQAGRGRDPMRTIQGRAPFAGGMHTGPHGFEISAHIAILSDEHFAQPGKAGSQRTG
jgi:hypothetical protein